MKKIYFLRNKAQTFIEYAVLIGVISAALIAMYQYVNRSIQAKLKQVQEEVSDNTGAE
jgi:Flp pilus assembly pilin Flp